MSAAELIAEASGESGEFDHRAHIRMSWLALRRHSLEEAIAVVSGAIQETARYAGAPQKYHATVSRAWVELVASHQAESEDCDFDAFVERYPDLLDKRLLSRFYSSRVLASTSARTGWVEPDLVPLPRRAG